MIAGEMYSKSAMLSNPLEALSAGNSRVKSISFGKSSSPSTSRMAFLYSERVSLLREAGQQGIGRFEANLIIASVQHQVQLAKSQEPSHQPRMFSNVLAGIALQGLIAWGIYRSMK